MKKHSTVTPSYERYIKSFRLLSAEEEIDLAKKYQAGDEKAKNKFYNSNLRLVLSIASRYRSVINHHSVLEFMDIVQAGNILSLIHI